MPPNNFYYGHLNYGHSFLVKMILCSLDCIASHIQYEDNDSSVMNMILRKTELLAQEGPHCELFHFPLNPCIDNGWIVGRLNCCLLT